MVIEWSPSIFSIIFNNFDPSNLVVEDLSVAKVAPLVVDPLGVGVIVLSLV